MHKGQVDSQPTALARHDVWRRKDGVFVLFLTLAATGLPLPVHLQQFL